MMILQDKMNCTGCYACVQRCPKKCISMSADENGFWYPTVNEELCVKCGMCEKACPLLYSSVNEKAREDIAVYSVVNKDESVRLGSSSGGVFYLMASCIIQRGGVVFGAAFNENFEVEHRYTDTISGIAVFQGSKYLQSKIGDSYVEAERFLKQGRLVMFTGTPCQIEGLLAYLRHDYTNLITQDIICHGVPSPLAWKKYVEYRENKIGAKVCRVLFRHKQRGWKTYSVLFEFENGEQYTDIYYKDPYMKAFLKNFTLRSSCYQCSFKSKYRASDITLADFWGVESLSPEMDDDKGTSLIFVNSLKGKQLFDSVQSNIRMKEEDIDSVIQYNSAMVKSVPQPSGRDVFMKMLSTKDWGVLNRKLLRENPLMQTYKKGVCLIKIALKKILKVR